MPFQELFPPRAFEFRWGGLYEHAERPLVEVEFAATTSEGILTGVPVRTAMLVDSGARSTVLDGQFAPVMGIDLSEDEYEKSYIGGIVPGATRWVAWATVLASLCGRWIPLKIAFTIDMAPTTNLLGRDGFFDRHLVAFAHDQRVVMMAEPLD